MIATGPPRSGKSFSLFGELGEFARMGIVPRLGSDILDHISGEEAKVYMTMSYYETGSGGAGRVRLPPKPVFRAAAKGPCGRKHDLTPKCPRPRRRPARRLDGWAHAAEKGARGPPCRRTAVASREGWVFEQIDGWARR